MKQYFIKLGNILVTPAIILLVLLSVFTDKLREIGLSSILTYILAIFCIFIGVGGFYEYLENKKK